MEKSIGNYLSIQDKNICELCDNPKNLEDYLLKEMRVDYPNFDLKKGWPANHPLWIKYQELLDAYPGMKKCLIFAYDDMVVGLCENCIRKILSENF
jgi:hypothetical protein